MKKDELYCNRHKHLFMYVDAYLEYVSYMRPQKPLDETRNNVWIKGTCEVRFPMPRKNYTEYDLVLFTKELYESKLLNALYAAVADYPDEADFVWTGAEKEIADLQDFVTKQLSRPGAIGNKNPVEDHWCDGE